MELWTSPSGQPAPCGTCGQAVDEAGASPTALTTLACFSPTGTTEQPQQRFFQYSDSSGLTAGEKGRPRRRGLANDHGYRVHCVVEIREGLAYAPIGLAFGQPPGIKKEDRTQASVPGETCALTREPVRQMSQESPSDVTGIPVKYIGFCSLYRDYARG